MNTRPNIYKAAAIIIRDRKALVERSFGKRFFVHPGGKLDPDETAQQALIRELKEELSIDVTEADFEEFDRSSAPAANNPEVDVHMTVYLVHHWQGEIKPGHEVEELRWITSEVPVDMEVGSIMQHETLPKLKAAELID